MFRSPINLPVHNLVKTGHSGDRQPEEVVNAAEDVAAQNGNCDEEDVHVELLKRLFSV